MQAALVRLSFLLLIPAIPSALARREQCPPCRCRNGVMLCSLVSYDFTVIPSNVPSDTWSLDLAHHAIAQIGDMQFASLTQLRSLNLKDNQIKHFTRSSFYGLEQLEILDLSSNRIRELPDNVFGHLRNLKTLYLHGNSISRLTKDTFNGLNHLQHLSLSSNQLTIFSKEVAHSMAALTVLEVARNSFHCNCSVVWMQNYAPLQSPLSEPGTCRSPPKLAGKRIDALTTDDLVCVSAKTEKQVAGFSREPVRLDCQVDGEPQPNVTWFHMQQVLQKNSTHYQVMENNSLLITALSPDLVGNYTCVASNPAGTSNSTVTVTSLGVRIPYLLQPPSDTHAFIGENVTLVCVGGGNTYSYKWLKDGVELSPSPTISLLPGVGLHISSAAAKHSGVYTCIGVGFYGEGVSASAFLTVTGPLLTCTGVIDSDTIPNIRNKVSLVFNHTLALAHGPTISPMDLIRRLRLPDSASLDLIKAAEVFQEVLAAARKNHSNSPAGGLGSSRGKDGLSLTSCQVVLLAYLSGCMQHISAPNCSQVCRLKRYRTMNGTCNNWDHPSWGSVDTPFLRLLAPDYDDGLGLPRGWSGGLPSARLVSQSVIRAHTVRGNEYFTHMLMQMGQFLDHDIDLAPITPSDQVFQSENASNDVCANQAPFFPIEVLPDDPRIHSNCMSFTRSAGICGTGSSSVLVSDATVRREQINAITAFIDGSQIYGSSMEHSEQLRDPARRGWLLEGEPGVTGKPFLPFDNQSLIECNTGVHSNRSACFVGGDVRTNEQVGLTTMHTIFFREHNRVASILSKINSNWSQEKLYQETRRLVVAEWQHIVYSEYLPIILGPVGMNMLGEYTGYNFSVNPSIANAFATAAYRFGHSQIMPLFERLDRDYKPLPIGPLRLQDAFFAPFRLLEEGGIDPILRGLVSTPVKQHSCTSVLNSNLTEALFAQANEVALDLAALNIQRGRDHGLPSYDQWRKYCGLPTQSPLVSIPDEGVRKKLRGIYSNISNIDLWVGGLLEGLVEGSQLGPTFLCIIADQFRRLRDGDRFWYERPGQFSSDQLQQLRHSSLARVICDNSDNIDHVPKDVLVLQHESQFSACDDLPTVDLSQWADCESPQGECQPAERGKRSVLLSEMKHDIDQLKKMVESLETKAQSCKCNGIICPDNTEWKMDECRACQCKGGEVVCKAMKC